MEQFIINIKDNSKLHVFLETIQKMDFVEVLKGKRVEETVQTKQDDYDFFQSAGLWKNRKIEAKQLRENAWKRKS